MAVAGNTRVIYAAIQSVKGTAATTPTHKFTMNTGTAGDPGRVIIQLPETDASQQQASNAVVGSTPTIGWTNWARPGEFAFLASAIQGANADTGAGPYTHTATPAATQAYYTLWDVLPSNQCTQYVDARANTLGVSGEALQGVQYTTDFIALSAVLGVTAPTLPAASATDRKLAYPDVTVTIGGSHPGTVDAFSITVNRNVSILRGDNGLAAFDSVSGVYAVEGTMRKIYASDADYRKFHGGSAGATTLSTTIFSEALDILVAIDATHSIDFASTLIEYTAVTVPVNVDGSPVLEEISFNTQRQSTWANNMTIVTKNAGATSVTTPA